MAGALGKLMEMFGGGPEPEPFEIDPGALTRLEFEAVQDKDNERLNNLQNVRKRYEQRQGAPIEDQLLSQPTPPPEPGGIMEPVRRAGDARQALLDALATQPGGEHEQ